MILIWNISPSRKVRDEVCFHGCLIIFGALQNDSGWSQFGVGKDKGENEVAPPVCVLWFELLCPLHIVAGEAVLPFWRVAPLEATCAHPTGELISTARCGYCWLRRLDTRHRPGSVMATFGFPLWLKVFAPSALLLFFELFALLATLASAAPPSPCWEPRGGNPSIIDMLSFLIQANALFKMFYYILNKIHPLCFCGCKVYCLHTKYIWLIYQLSIILNPHIKVVI